MSLELARETDPSAVACSSRRPGEPWFVFEQPDRAGAAHRSIGGPSPTERSGGANPVVQLTLAVSVSPDDTPEDLLARLERRLAELRSDPLPLLDPAPTGRFQIASTMPPEHFEAA